MDYKRKTRILGICHMVMAGLTLLGIPLLLLHRYVMTHFDDIVGSEQTEQTLQAQQQFEAILPFMDIVYAVAAFFIGLAFLGNLLAGIGLFKHKWKILIAIVSGLNCLSFPFGLALGIFTFVAIFSEEGGKYFAARASDEITEQR